MVLNTISFLSFKQMFDAVTALDGRPIDFKLFQSSSGLFIFLSRISFTELSFLFPNKILSLILYFFVIFFINVKLWHFKLSRAWINSAISLSNHSSVLQLTRSNSNSEGSSEFVRITESSNYTSFHQNFNLS